MDRLIAAFLRRLPDRLLEAVNAVSFNLLDQRGLIIWENTDPRARWRYFTVRRNTLPAQTGAVTTATTSAGSSPAPLPVWLLTFVLFLVGLTVGGQLGRCRFNPGAPQPASPELTQTSTPAPTGAPTPAPTDTVPLDFSDKPDHENPSPQPTKQQPTNKSTRPKTGVPPSPH